MIPCFFQMPRHRSFVDVGTETGLFISGFALTAISESCYGHMCCLRSFIRWVEILILLGSFKMEIWETRATNKGKASVKLCMD